MTDNRREKIVKVIYFQCESGLPYITIPMEVCDWLADQILALTEQASPMMSEEEITTIKCIKCGVINSINNKECVCGNKFRATSEIIGKVTAIAEPDVCGCPPVRGVISAFCDKCGKPISGKEKEHKPKEELK